MNIDANTPERDVLIAYLENSGVSQQKEAAKVIREMQEENDLLIEFVKKRDVIIDRQAALINKYDEAISLIEKQSKQNNFISRIVLWFKGK